MSISAGDCERNAVIVFALFLDVEGRIIISAAAIAGLAFEQVEQSVEADGGTAVGGKIKT